MLLKRVFFCFIRIEKTYDTHPIKGGKHMKGKRLLILGAAFALGISACAQATTMVRKNPFRAGEGSTESVDFSAQGYSNQQAIESYAGTNFAVAFNKGSNSNAPKYYTSGSAIRAYGGNYFTVSSSTKVFTEIALTFGNSDGTNAITTDVVTYSNGTWSGESNSVKFTIGGSSGNRRIAGIAVTFKDGSGSSSSSSSSESSSSSSSSSSQEPTTINATFAEALAAGKALGDGNVSTDYYKFQGYVRIKDGVNYYLTATSNEAYSADNAIELYKAGENSTLAGILLKDAKVEVTMILKNYRGTVENKDTLTASDITVIEAGTAWPTVVHQVSVSEALTVISGLSNNETTADLYEVQGFITEVTTAWSDQHSNISYNLGASADATDNLLAIYRSGAADGTDHTKFVAGAEVKVVGNLQKYVPNGGSAVSQLKNGSTTLVAAAPEPVVRLVSISEALAVAQALENNTESFDSYQIQGYITETEGWSAQYSNIDYILGNSVINPTNTIKVYRSVAADGTNGQNLKVGDEVIVVGKLKKYVNSSDVTTLEVVSCTTTLVQAALTVSLDKTSLRLDFNETAQLAATIDPEGSNKTITWLSSNSAIATVSASGLVSANNVVGDATITAFVDLNGDGSLSEGEPSAACVVSVVNASAYVEALYKQALFAAENNSAGVTTYTTTWSSTTNGFKVNVANGSNNNNGWSGVIKFGRKEVSVGSISTDTAIDKAISKVVINFTAVNATYVNSIKLQTSSNGSDWDDAATFTAAAGEQTAEVASPAANLFYRVVFDLKANTSSNGFVALNSVSYYSIEEASSITPEHYLQTATTVATIHGSESVSETSGSYSLSFDEAGLANGERIRCVGIGSAVLVGDKGTNSSYPAYYTDGNEVRVYSGNTLTFESKATITRIELTFVGSSSGIDVDVGALDDNVWTGEESSITFTNGNSSGNLKISAVSVTTAGSVQVSSAAIRFGAAVAQQDWNDILENNWEIEDYGVMLLKKDTLINYGFDSVEEAYRAKDENKPVTIARKGSGDTPYPDGTDYLFTVKVNVKVANYGVVFCAAPFVVVDGEYYFLNEAEYSVNSLAQHYLKNDGASLSNEALSMLSRNWED